MIATCGQKTQKPANDEVERRQQHRNSRARWWLGNLDPSGCCRSSGHAQGLWTPQEGGGSAAGSSSRPNRPSSEGRIRNEHDAGDLAHPPKGETQLRDSTGIAPASLSSMPPLPSARRLGPRQVGNNDLASPRDVARLPRASLEELRQRKPGSKWLRSRVEHQQLKGHCSATDGLVARSAHRPADCHRHEVVRSSDRLSGLLHQDK